MRDALLISTVPLCFTLCLLFSLCCPFQTVITYLCSSLVLFRVLPEICWFIHLIFPILIMCRIFSPEEDCEVIESEKHSHIFYQAEPDIWMVLVMDPDSTNTSIVSSRFQRTSAIKFLRAFHPTTVHAQYLFLWCHWVCFVPALFFFYLHTQIDHLMGHLKNKMATS
jgi:hypothetical protein